MFRRSHKKSRNGCAECKRRHMKCDETRPRCVNCAMVDRKCVYPPSSEPKPSATQSGDTSSEAATPNPDAAAGSPAGRSPTVIPTPDLAHFTGNAATSPGPDATVNMCHMKLLFYFSLDIVILTIDENLCECGTRLILKTGTEVPYLLHAVLALSARHLSVIEPEKRTEYLNHSVQLQTRAISLFNAQRARIKESTCVPMVLFSSVLGRHLCIEALAFRGPDFDAFLDCYVAFSRIHRGTRVIVDKAWPLLRDSEMCALMAWGMGLSRLRSQGHHCDGILRLLSASKTVEPGTFRVDQNAVEFIQIAVDDLRDRMFTGAKNLFQIVFAWSLLIEEKFAEMLVQRRPEAIAVLAHYAAILHLAREYWQIGDSGAYLLNLICQYLGPEWEEWIAWPRSVVFPEGSTPDIQVDPSI